MCDTTHNDALFVDCRGGVGRDFTENHDAPRAAPCGPGNGAQAKGAPAAKMKHSLTVAQGCGVCAGASRRARLCGGF